VFVVVFVMGDFFSRQLLLPGSIFVVTCSCLRFWVVKVFRVFWGCVSCWAQPFPFWFDWGLHHRISYRLSYILCASFRWAGYFCFEIGSWCLATTLFGLVYRGWVCPFDLVLKSGGPIAFDSRLGASFFDSSWVLGFEGVLSVDWRWRGGGSWMIFRIRAFRMWLSFGVEDWEFNFEGWVMTMGGDGYRFTMVVFMKASILGGDVYFGGLCPYGCWR